MSSSGVRRAEVARIRASRLLRLRCEPGIDDFRARKIARAFYSDEMWRRFYEAPDARLLTGARVTEVEGCPGAPPYDPLLTLPYGSVSRGTIWVHAAFGIPYRKIETSCGRAAAG